MDESRTKSLRMQVGLDYPDIRVVTTDGQEPEGQEFEDVITAYMEAYEAGCGQVYKDGCMMDLQDHDLEDVDVMARAVGIVVTRLIVAGYKVAVEPMTGRQVD